jgi:hypothetical protein
VNDAVGGWPPDTSAAYLAMGEDQSAQQLLLPLIRNKHMPTRASLTTGVQIMNVSSAPAYVEVHPLDPQGVPVACPGCSEIVTPYGAYTWYPPNVPGFPEDFYGTATITSDQPVAAIVNDASMLPFGLPVMDAAINPALPCAEGGPTRVAVP